MAAEVIQKIVEMRFNNNQFESKVKESLASLVKLKDALDFSGAKKGLDAVASAASNLNFSVVGNAVDQVSHKFSLMQVAAITAMTDVTRWAERTGKTLVKSLSVDQISAGWNKYTEKTASVQTIMNATGLGLEDVNGYLEKLMRFSDQTSFSFSEMTSALAQMTSSGGDIEKLMPMITGIANATAFAGKGGAEFQSTIRNLAQSYSAGALNLQDMKSLNLMGTSSKQLKQTFIDMGVALGTIKEGEVTLENFDQSLSKKWANTEVMEKALGKFSAFYEAVDKAVEEKKYANFNEAMEAMQDNFDELSVKAFSSAQEAKSFGEAIEATKDAVSSSWLASFEIIFGNYEEAKVLWTDLSDALWKVFAAGGEIRNDILAIWKEDGGRDNMIQAFWNLWEAIGGVTSAVKEGLGLAKKSEEEIQRLGKRLSDITRNAERVTRSFKDFFIVYDEIEKKNVFTKNGQFLVNTFKGLYGVAKTLKFAFEQVGSLFKVVRDIFFNPTTILETTSKMGLALDSLMEKTRDLIEKAFVPLRATVYRLSRIIKNEAGKIIENFNNIRATFKINLGLNKDLLSFSHIISDTFTTISSFIAKTIPVIVDKFNTFANRVADAVYNIVMFFAEYKDSIFSFVKMLAGDAVRIFTFFYTKVEDIVSGLFNILGKFVNFLINHRDTIYAIFMTIRAAFFLLLDALDAVWAQLLKIPEKVRQVLAKIKETSIGTFFVELAKSIKESIFGIQSSIDKLGKTDTEGASRFAENIKKIFSPFTLIWTGVKKGFEILGRVFTAVGPTIIAIGNAMGTVIGSIFTGLGNLVKSGSMRELTRTLGEGAVVGLLFKKLFGDKSKNPIASLADSIESFKEGLSSTFGALTDTLTAFQESIKAKTLLNIAIAVGILTVSIIALSAVDVAKLAISLGAIKLGFSQMISVMDTLSSYNKDRAANIKRLAPVFLTLAASMIIMAIAIKSLAKVGIVEMATSLLGFAVAFQLLIKVMDTISNYNQARIKNIKKAAPVFITLGLSMMFMATAVRILAKLKPEEVAVGVVAVAGLVGTIVYAMSYLADHMQNTKGMAGMAAVIASLTNVILVSALAIAGLSFIPADKLQNGIIGFAAIITAIGALLYAFSSINVNVKQMLTLAATFTMIATSIALLAPAVAIISMVPIDKLQNGVIALAAIVALIGIMMVGIKTNPSQLIALAGSFMIMALAIAVLAPALIAMSLVPVKGLLKVVAVFAVLGAGLALAVKFLGPVIPVLKSLATTMLLVGAAMLMAGIGLTAIMASGVALDAFVGLMLEVLYRLLDYIIELIPYIIEQVGKGLIDLLVVLRDAIPPLLDICYEAIIGVCDVLLACTEPLLNTVGFMLMKLIDFVLTFGPPLIQGIVDIFLMIPRELYSRVGDVINGFFDIIIAIIDGISEGIERFAPRLREALLRLCKSLWNAFLDFFGIHSPSRLFAEGGGYLVQGLISGIKNFVPNAMKTVSDLCSGIWSKFKGFFGIKSPSRLFKTGGKYLMQGLANGINGTASVVGKAMAGVSEMITDSFDSAYLGSNIGNGLAKGLDNTKKSVIDSMMDISTGLDNSVRDYFGIHSPSLRMEKTGLNIGAGTAVGIEKSEKEITKATKKSMSGIEEVAYNMIEGVESYFSKGLVEDVGYLSLASDVLNGKVAKSDVADKALSTYLEYFANTTPYTSQTKTYGDVRDNKTREKNVEGTATVTKAIIAPIVDAVERTSDYNNTSSKKKFTAVALMENGNGNLIPVVDTTPKTTPKTTSSDSSAAAGGGSSSTTGTAASAAQSSGSTDRIDYGAIVKKQFADDITKIVKELYDIRQDIQSFKASVADRQVVLDSGALVGSLSSTIDKALGQNAALAARGV